MDASEFCVSLKVIASASELGPVNVIVSTISFVVGSNSSTTEGDFNRKCVMRRDTHLQLALFDFVVTFKAQAVALVAKF